VIELCADMWTVAADARCVTTNGYINKVHMCVMGRGTARQAATRYPWLPLHLGYLITVHGNECFPIWTPDGWLVSFPVKHRWEQSADPRLIEQSCKQLVRMTDLYDWHKVVLPRPGAGNGWLEFDTQVKPVIAPLLDGRFYVVTFG